MRTILLRSFTILFFLKLLLSTAKADTIVKDSIYNIKIATLIETKPTSYDSIAKYLGKFRRDTSKMKMAMSTFSYENYGAGVCYASNFLASSYLHYSEYEKALYYFDNALQLASELSDAQFKIIILNKLGVVYRRTNRIRSSIDYHQQARALANELNTKSKKVQLELAKSENSIGNCYTILDQHRSSLPHFERALSIEKDLDNKLGMAINFQNIGHANELLGNTDVALEYYNKSLAKNEEINSSLGKIICYNSIARILITQEEYVEAEKMIKPLIPAIKERNDNFHTSLVLLNYGDLMTKTGRFDQAESTLQEALFLSLQHDLSFGVIESYEKLSELESGIGNFKKALTYQSLANEASNKVINERNNQYINDLVYKYDSNVKTQQIADLSSENQAYKSRLRINRIILGSATFGALCFMGMIFTYFHQRQKRKDEVILSLKREHQIKTLESLIKGEEQERNRIARELHDGLNGDLSAIKFKLNKITEASNLNVSEVLDMLDKSCQQVRNISHNLIPPSLENFNLVEAADEFCVKMDQVHSEKIHFQHLGDQFNLDKKAEVNIYRIIQELVTNSIKHANANEISVQLCKRGPRLEITVEDDGKGFDPNRVNSDGIGLKNIQSRVDYLGADLDFSSGHKGASYYIELNTFNPSEN